MTYTIQDFGPNDLVTSQEIGIRRVAVDSQQTSFEANHQFRFFDELNAIPFASQLVYRFSTNEHAINIFERTLNIWKGGRKYLVYRADGNETSTGVFTDVSNQIFTVNSHLKPKISVHPSTTVTVERAVGVGIFSSTSPPRVGTAVLTDGNSHRAQAGLQGSADRVGVGHTAVFYLVLDHIGAASNDTDGLFLLLWEERFDD